MTVISIDKHWASMLIDQDLFLLSLVLSGLNDVKSSLSMSLFGDNQFCRRFETEFDLKEVNWEGRRTSRNLTGRDLNIYQKTKLIQAMELMVDHTSLVSPSLDVRKLTDVEVKSLVTEFRSQATINENAFCIGFFMSPKEFSSARDNWVFIGAASQLLCVLAHKISCGVFLSHGVEQIKYSYPLRNLEYVLFFYGESYVRSTDSNL